MRLFDSHAHLDMTRGGMDGISTLLDNAWAQGLAGILTIAGATKTGGYDDTFNIVGNDSRIWIAAGIHPHAGSRATPDALDRLRFILDRDKVVALGEIGLDYYYNHSEPAVQRRAFISQLRMAHDANLPVAIHTRDADDDTVAILRDEGAQEIGGVIHCFSSAHQLADAALDMGFYLSFSGIVTFPKTIAVQEVAAAAPEDRILAETDSPFLSPIPFRGKVNEPARVRYVVDKLAELRDIDPEDMGRITVENAAKCFGISI